MESNEPIPAKSWKTRLAAYLLIGGVILLLTGALAGITKNPCCIFLFAAGIVGVLLAAVVVYRW